LASGFWLLRVADFRQKIGSLVSIRSQEPREGSAHACKTPQVVKERFLLRGTLMSRLVPGWIVA